MSKVCTDPGKVWKVLELNVEIFIGMEKSGKILENSNADLENTDVYYTVDDQCICYFFAVHDTKHLKFKVQKFESHLIFRVEEYIV